MTTTRQSITSMVRSFTAKGKPFFYSNYKLSVKLGKSEKTISNTISLMKKEGELEIFVWNKIRYLKLISKKNVISEPVKKFYKTSGTNEGTIKGIKSGSDIYNINISKAKASNNQQIITEKPIDLTLMNDIKKIIPVFNSKALEKLVCNVDEKIIRKTLKEFKINKSVNNPAGLFTHNIYENIRITKELNAANAAEKKQKQIDKQETRKLEELKLIQDLKTLDDIYKFRIESIPSSSLNQQYCQDWDKFIIYLAQNTRYLKNGEKEIDVIKAKSPGDYKSFIENSDFFIKRYFLDWKFGLV